jgi:hypothetical protein
MNALMGGSPILPSSRRSIGDAIVGTLCIYETMFLAMYL